MSKNQSCPHVPGATPEEAKALKNLKKVDIIKAMPADVTRWYVDKFIDGEDVPDFVRSSIMQYVHEKSQELGEMAVKSIDN